MRWISLHSALCLMLIGMLVFLAACGTSTATTNSPAASPATTVQAAATNPASATTAAATTPAATTASAATTVATITAPMTTVAAATTAATTGAAATTASAETAATPGPNQFVNPVLNQDFPDPDVFKVGDTYYAYATNSASKNIQAAKSADLVHWQVLSDVLPSLPAWSEKGHTWAPDVSASADGKSYVMYFVARHTTSTRQCIGVATSMSPEGPFTSSSAEPFVCQTEQGGSIDPASFVDTDGTRYVLWKNDGNCCSQDTWIYIQKVSPDGMTLTGQPTKLIHQDQAWEGRLVEAPILWKHNNKYDLFYSANNYAGADYAIGYAIADNILGPYQKPSSDPLVKTVPADTGRAPVLGPGGQDIVVGKDGSTWMVYHSWDITITYREMNIDKLTWDGDKPVLQGPMVTPENLP